jgi:hypothetical protein
MFSALMFAGLLSQATLPGAHNAPPQTQSATVSAGTNIRAPMTAEEEAAPEQICRMEPVTGSRFPVRVCRSPRVAAAGRDDSRDMLRRMQGLPELPNHLSGPRTGQARSPVF